VQFPWKLQKSSEHIGSIEAIIDESLARTVVVKVLVYFSRIDGTAFFNKREDLNPRTSSVISTLRSNDV